ncbi:MAG: succinate dehydrogenase, cytochrome b556 subunit [Steroidobacteraceae bacterium]|jgi:succinate dehydrogenase / fumarate reductase cytochrome b subunit
MPERPVSPHVTVYKWTYTMTLSILHRVSGLALCIALIALVSWLLAAAAGPAAYAAAMLVLASLPVKILIAIALLALSFHFANGLRHLAWDAGWGFERAQARRSAAVVVAVALLAALAAVLLMFWTGPVSR